MAKKWRSSKTRDALYMIMKRPGMQFIVFDTETTGLDASSCQIIQISAIKCVVDEDLAFHEVDRLNEYIYPNGPVPPEITRITGITDAMLRGKPNEKEIFPKIEAFFGHKAVICGHNVQFDDGFLKATYRRNGSEVKTFMLNTLDMARDLHERKEAGSFKLGDLAKYFGVDKGLSFHNSMDDVVATMRLLRLFIDEYREKEGEEKMEGKKAPAIRYCRTMKGYRGMQRLYVHLASNMTDDDAIWFDQVDQKWGEKTKGLLEQLDMEYIEQSVLRYCKCNNLDELKKYRYNQLDISKI